MFTMRRAQIFAVLLLVFGFGIALFAQNAPALKSVTLAPTNGVTGIFIGQENQLLVKCNYSDGTSDFCNTVDVNGNVATGYTSSSPAATVSPTGMITGVSVGSASFTATVGTMSTQQSHAVTVLPAGPYTFSLAGGTYSVNLSGNVITVKP
jgi:ABC-type nitrate/sulfonate/bicarbonate transport system substrate-binding protein